MPIVRTGLTEARLHFNSTLGSVKTVYLFTTFLLLTLAEAQAKPLSYVGGTMVMQENDETVTLSLLLSLIHISEPTRH